MKGHDKIKEFIEGELSDYSYFEMGELKWNNAYGEFEEEDGEEHYIIDIKKGNEKTKTLNFNYDRKEDKIEVELGEDSWNEVTTYDWRVKYFWMALLEW